MEFWKRGFGERSYSSLERVFQGEKDDVIVEGQSGEGDGGDGREDGGEDGFLGGKRGRRRWRNCCCCWNGGENGGVVGSEGGGGGSRPREATLAVFWGCRWWLAIGEERRKKMKEREGKGVFI